MTVVPKDRLCDACYTIVENSAKKSWLECMRQGLLHDRCGKRALWAMLTGDAIPFKE